MCWNPKSAAQLVATTRVVTSALTVQAGQQPKVCPAALSYCLCTLGGRPLQSMWTKVLLVHFVPSAFPADSGFRVLFTRCSPCLPCQVSDRWEIHTAHLVTVTINEIKVSLNQKVGAGQCVVAKEIFLLCKTKTTCQSFPPRTCSMGLPWMHPITFFYKSRCRSVKPSRKPHSMGMP